jgi:antitoxin ParD1/3/4
MNFLFFGDLTMGTIPKTITVTDQQDHQQDQWIKAQIEAGDFTNDSEYILDLIRRDQDNAKFQALKTAVEEGMTSADSSRTIPQIMKKVESRLRADGRL